MAAHVTKSLCSIASFNATTTFVTRDPIATCNTMTVDTVPQHDAHEQPPDALKAAWKAVSRADPSALLANASFSSSSSSSAINDPRLPPEQSGFTPCGSIPGSRIADAFSNLLPGHAPSLTHDDRPVLHHPLLPGLLIVPDLLPPPIQLALLDATLHRDLSNPAHQTNLHLHYALPYPPPSTSFFSLPPDSSPPPLLPHDPAVHKPLSIRQFLHRRLHWLTLGGQYDWTNRVYPADAPPAFPADLAGFLRALFPATDAQAAIVNVYSPGDTMMMHRDVSERADRGLVSVSLGCECLFMIAPNQAPSDKEEYLLVRLRSGDAVYMTQEARYAWHGVPKVLGGTCPEYLADWPAVGEDGERFEAWRGWMRSKRINLNVRQMTE